MGSNHMHDLFRAAGGRDRTNKKPKPTVSEVIETDMDKLNRFLITVANTENVGIRRKIIMIKKFLEVLGNKED
jgi:hypothetical protein